MDPKRLPLTLENSTINDSAVLISRDNSFRHSLSIVDRSIPNNYKLPPSPISPMEPPPQTTLNINDKSTRLTLWAVLILIVSIAEINFTLSMRIYYRTYKKQFNAKADPNPYTHTPIYDILSVSSNIILFVAATLILLGIHKSTISKIITSTMFILGAIVHLLHCIWGMHLYCIDDAQIPTINNDNAYCRLSFLGSDLYLQLFLIFYCIDIIKSYGNNIRFRIFIHSLLLSSIGFINSGNTYHDDKEFKKDVALIFASTVVASGYLIIALITSLIFTTICLVYCSYWLTMSETNDGYSCNASPIVRRIIGFILLCSIGMVLTSPYIYIFVTGSVDEIGTPPIHSLTYYIIGAILFVYDLQYVS